MEESDLTPTFSVVKEKKKEKKKELILFATKLLFTLWKLHMQTN